MNDIKACLDGFLDAGAEALADIEKDWDREKEIIRQQNRELTVDIDAALAPLKERISRLEGAIEMLTCALTDSPGLRSGCLLWAQRAEKLADR